MGHHGVKIFDNRKKIDFKQTIIDFQEKTILTSLHRTTSNVTQILHDLGWRDLSDRRRDPRLALLYKVVTGHVAVGPDQTSLVAADNRTRANHRFKFKAIGASSSGLRSSFAARTIGDWNQLPAVVVEQESPTAL